MKKRLLAMLVCAVLLITLLPVTALAATEDYTLFYTNGKLYTDGASTTEYPSDNTWSGDGDTLTLTNFHFTTTAAIAMHLSSGTTLVLNGTNTVTSVDTFDLGTSSGIFCPGLLTITGSGSLTASAGKGNSSFGLWVLDLAMEGGTVRGIGIGTSNNAAGSTSCGVSASLGDITVTGGTLTGMGGAAGSSCGVYAGEGNITVSTDGSITGTGGVATIANANKDDGCSYGVYAKGGSITVAAGGSITGTGDEGTGGSYGVAASGTDGKEIMVTGGSLTAYGPNGALHATFGGDSCLKAGPAGAGKGLIFRYSGDPEETNWGSVAAYGAVFEGYTSDFGNGSVYFTNPSVRISEASAVSGTVTDTAGAPVNHPVFFCRGSIPAQPIMSVDNTFSVYLENGDYTLSAEKGTQTGSISFSVSGTALTGMNIVLGNASTPGITVSPAATFQLGDAPDRLTLLVGETGSMPNRAAHFGSLEISSDNTSFTRVDPANYDLQYGSIHIELGKDWLDTLPLGVYTLRVNLAGAYAGISPTTQITVTAPAPVPDTGDSSQPVLWLGLALIACAGLTGGVIARRKRQNG